MRVVRSRRSTRRAKALAGVGVAAGVAVGYRLVVQPALRHWGASGAESVMTLPGDELVPDGPGMTTRAVTVEAPAEEVWAWLVQIGVGRGGWYSYDWLERVVGIPIHNTHELRDEWQHLAEGDRVVLAPEGWMGLPGGYVLPVARLDPGRAIVLRQRPPEHPWDGIWSFHIQPIDGATCRLLARSRTTRPRRLGARTMAAAGAAIGEPITFVMERRMLIGIRHRAERHYKEQRAEEVFDAADVILAG